jgi:pyruvate dehydrogenase E2 component (dihydrolipoamide acetyltransferase)
VYADVVLPNLGFGMEEGRVITWLKGPGDAVHKGEAIAEIESDKATVELEAVVDGTLEEITVPAGTVAAVGGVLARIRTERAVPTAPPLAPGAEPSHPIPGRATPVAERLAREHGIDLAQVTGTGPGGRILREDVQAVIDRVASQPATDSVRPKVLAAPAVRKLARDHDIDLSSIRGTGKDGHVTRADVEAALAAGARHTTRETVELPPVSLDDGRREVPVSQMRRAIARLLAQTVQEAPQFYTTAELDVTHALAVLPKEIGINNLILYVTIQALKDIPELNATYEDGHLYEYEHVNLAVAVALPSGLITPVLHRADDYSLAALAERARNLIVRARENRLRREELSGGSFTVSNLGMVQQVERFTAILNPPQVGILAVGAAKDRPVVIDGGLHIRKTVYVTLTADHRIVDGLVAARFLEAFDHRLQIFAG